jgi:hypothetical protein
VTAGDARARLESARACHRKRSLAVRILIVTGGGFVALLGGTLLVPVPELGLPLLLVGLRLLALEYEWAARAYVPIARLWDRAKALPAHWKIAIAAVCIFAVGAIVWWLA